MRRKNEQPVTDILREFLSESGLETPLLQYRLVESWPEVVGEPFSSHSHAIEIRNEVLWVGVDSPSLITELQMRRTSLVQLLNQRVGAVIIKDIRFMPQ